MKATNILVASAMVLLMAVSCKKQGNNTDNLQTTANGKSKISLLAESDCDCCNADSVDLDFFSAANDTLGVLGMDAGKYESWEKDTVELCPNGLKIMHEGPFGSFFRVNIDGQTGWNLGAVPVATGDGWCNDILPALTTLNQRCNNNGPTDTTSVYAPPASSPRPFIIGLDGTTAGLNFALGYYIYNPDRTTNIINDIIAWKNCPTADSCAAPSTATIAYRIRVDYSKSEAIPGTTPTRFKGLLKYSWECLDTSCE